MFYKLIDRTKLLLLFLILALCACHTELVKNLRLISNVYIDKNGNPFNGIAKGYFDSGELSGKTTFKNGIPTGEWTSYGYSGELIQTGTFRIYYLKTKTIGPAKDVIRVNVDTFYEGTAPTIDIIIINNSVKKYFKRQDDLKLFNEVISVLKFNNIPLNDGQIDGITFAKGEFESVTEN